MIWVTILAQLLGPIILEMFRAWLEKHKGRTILQRREARKVFYAACKQEVRRKKGKLATVSAHGTELKAYELRRTADEVLADLRALVEAA